MEFKHTKKTVIEVDSFDLDNFINHHFPNAKHKFGFVPAIEGNNDSSYTFDDITGNPGWEESDEFLEWAERGKYPGFCTPEAVLNVLCHRKLIPAGDYLVDVCW